MKIVSSAKMAAIDNAYAAGLPPHTLIHRAGALLAEEIRKLSPGRVFFLCGPGKNGADGFAAALGVAAEQIPVLCFTTMCSEEGKMTSSPEELSPEAYFRRKAEQRGLPVLPLSALPEHLPGAPGDSWIVDALFGTGLSRPLKGVAAEAVHLVNASGLPVLSVDIPSGLSGDTGKVPGGEGEYICPVRTVTFTLPKPIHVLCPEKCGELRVADIGIPTDGETVYYYGGADASFEKEDALRLLPPRVPESHKGAYGKAALFVGGRGYAGAAMMATGSALRSGVGLLWSFVPECVYPQVSARLPDAITIPLDCNADGSLGYPALCDPRLLPILKGADSFGIGSGLIPGPAARRLFAKLLASGKPMTVDAGALRFPEVERREGKERLSFEGIPLHENIILTPHGGELCRLLGNKSPEEFLEIPRDTPTCDVARLLARRLGCILVMKGHRTIVASPHGAVSVNTTGNPGMARGGSGDILCGLITGYAARMPAFDAACLGVFMAGQAGDRMAEKKGENAMSSWETLEELGNL